MDDPIAIPIYVGIASYLVCIVGGLKSTRRTFVITFCGVGALVASICLSAFTHGIYSIHVGMSGDPNDFSFLIPILVGVLLFVPFVAIGYFKLISLRESAGIGQDDES
jgi:hypothetical protein